MLKVLPNLDPKTSKDAQLKSELQRRNQESISFKLDEIDIETYELDEWNINHLVKNTAFLNNSLAAIFKKMNFFSTYKIDETKFSVFIARMKVCYSFFGNPYHNYNHGVQVCHSMYWLLQNTRLGSFVNDLQRYAAVIAALAHDMGHRGVTNAFEVAMYTELAITYHDQSVLENYHATLLFDILKDDNANILQPLTQAQFRTVRATIIKCILATDMSKHKDHEKKVLDDEEFYSTVAIGELEESRQPEVLAFMTHVCDLAGSAKEWGVSRAWGQRVRQEFSAQVILIITV